MQAKWLTALVLTTVVGGASLAVAVPASYADAAPAVQGAAADAPGVQGAAAEAPPGSGAAAGFSGYQVLKLPNANVANFARRTIRCPAGKRVVGGGAEAQGNEAVLVGSFPTDETDGWIGLGRQPNNATVGVSVYVICANAS
ncbi:hypothetical protein [Sphaerisporangium corydalis]|uniref:Secreted protein n=1 Tax=Sphaerisporangium corydalis TaxID=1441875 RepID=A0ABV9EEY8_9ACTN|nr:hypothetical protein [Sphaerisporangium corydalis]